MQQLLCAISWTALFWLFCGRPTMADDWDLTAFLPTQQAQRMAALSR
jgi:hypothetical protein